MASSSSSRALVLLLLTSGFFISGLVFDYMPMIIDDYIKRTVELATNEEIISFWSKPPVDIHSYYWIYSIENPEQFKSMGERAQIRKLGPFHFTAKVQKRVVELAANKYRIIYNSSRIMRLNESFAGNAEQFLDEQVTILNPIYVSIAEGARVQGRQLDDQTQAAVMVGTLNRLTQQFNETLLMNTTVRAALMGRSMPIVEKLRRIAQTMGVDMTQVPELAPGGKFGYVALNNNTVSGPFEIYTGFRETAKSLGELISYRGKRRLNYFDGRCNRLQASAGELRPMPIDPSQRLEMFVPNFCRIVHLRPLGVLKLREGAAVSYVVAPEDFASAHRNPDNRCFCVNGTENNYCSLDGAIEVAPCSFSAPILITLSNLELDPKITSSIQNWEPELYTASGLPSGPPMAAPVQLGPADGGEPNASRALDQAQLDPMQHHQMLILRRLGVPIHVDLTITLLMKVVRDERFKQLMGVPEVSYIPLATIKETVSLPASLGQVIVNLESFLALTYHVKVIMYLSSLVLLCWLTAFYYCGTSVRAGPRQLDRVVPAGGPGGPNGSGPGARARRSLANQQPAPATEPAKSADDSDRPGNGAGPGAAAGGHTGPMQAGDTTSSDRANSADSSRSQPPSRRTTSRIGSLEASGLLDEPPVGLAGAPEPATPAPPPNYGDPGAAGRGSDAHLASKLAQMVADGANSAAAQDATESSDGRKQSSGAAGGPSARFFSKVDEELSRQQVARPDGDRRASADQDRAPAEPRRRRSPRSWFMNVYSGFVRMLHGLRSSIGEVGQLDVSENDYQDKQLEMLAGKIDNWYSGQQEQTADGSSPIQPDERDHEPDQRGQQEPADAPEVVAASVSGAPPDEATESLPDAADRRRQEAAEPSDFATSAVAAGPDKLQPQPQRQPETTLATLTSAADRHQLTDGPARRGPGRDKEPAGPGKGAPGATADPSGPVERHQLQSAVGLLPAGSNDEPDEPADATGARGRAESGATSSSQDSAQTTISRQGDTNKLLGAAGLSSADEDEQEDGDTEDPAALADEDANYKASALEHMEAALNNGPGPRQPAAGFNRTMAVGDLAAQRRRDQGPRLGPQMINSSTMTSPGDYEPTSSDSAMDSGGSMGGTTHLTSSGQSAEAGPRRSQPDDQSGAARLNRGHGDARPLDESLRLAGAGQRSLGAPARHRLGSPAAELSGQPAADSGQDSGRAHEGVKLDSRNGISNSIGAPTTPARDMAAGLSASNTSAGQVSFSESRPVLAAAGGQSVSVPDIAVLEASVVAQPRARVQIGHNPSGGQQGPASAEPPDDDSSDRADLEPALAAAGDGSSGRAADGAPIGPSEASIQLINGTEAARLQPPSASEISAASTGTTITTRTSTTTTSTTAATTMTKGRNGQQQAPAAANAASQSNGNNISNGKIMSQQQRQQQIQDSTRNGMVAA